jgi:N-acetylglucosaminyldiphosphoundecaprenol N-acetyl-beta-D-mannosaminyltransferase
MNQANLITFVNTFSYYRLLDSGFPLKRIDRIFVDGVFQVKLHNLFYKAKINRASFDFSSMADDLFVFVKNNNLKIALMGATKEEIVIAVNNLKKKYSGLRIIHSRDGYFNSEEEKNDLYITLKEKNPDIVILGMGTPEQENFAVYLNEKGLYCTIITCGGFLSQTAKNQDYYWPIIKKLNLRWLQRAIEYKHVRKRLFIHYPKNIIRYCMDHIMLLVKNH